MKKITVFIIVLMCKGFCAINAQGTSGKVNSTQPSIMLIPFTKEGEDIRTVIEDNFNIRTGFTKINEAFNNRGFSTKDFRTVLKQIKRNDALNMENQQSLRQQIMKNSPAEISIEFDMQIESAGAYGKSVAINLNAYDNYTGQNLTSEVCRNIGGSGVSISLTTEKAIEKCIEQFLNTMQGKFDDIVKNGRTYLLDISLDNNSEYNMFSEFGSDYMLLMEIIEAWVADNAYNNYYSLSDINETNIYFDELKLPLKDPKSGRNYHPIKFLSDLRRYLSENHDITCQISAKENSLYVTIK